MNDLNNLVAHILPLLILMPITKNFILKRSNSIVYIGNTRRPSVEEIRLIKKRQLSSVEIISPPVTRSNSVEEILPPKKRFTRSASKISESQSNFA